MAAGLVLTRKVGEKIMIGDDIVVTLTQIKSGTTVKIGVEAPREVQIDRAEMRGDFSKFLRARKEGKPCQEQPKQVP